ADATVVQWTDVPGFDSEGTVTFQVVLFLDGTIDIQYADMTSASFLGAATIGIENTGGADGAQVVFNSDYVEDDMAIRFMPPLEAIEFITAITPLSGSLGEGEEETITVTLDATGLEPEVYLQELTVSSNSTEIVGSTATFELTVEEASPSISFVLIDATTDTALVPIADGDVINVADFPAVTDFNIEAITGDLVVESVVFDFSGQENFRTENVAPYALGGDISGDFSPLSLPFGMNTLTATAYTEDRGAGAVSATTTISFEVIEVADDAAISFNLIDATTDQVLGAIEDNAVIDLSDYEEGTKLTVEAVVTGLNDESVVFDFNDTVGFRTENVEPYALAGDINSDFSGAPLILGSNMVTASAFSGNSGTGDLLESSTITFMVLGGDNEMAVRISPNPSSDRVAITLNQGKGPKMTATLYNVYGQAVYTNLKLDFSSGDGQFINVSGLAEGMYILELRDAKGVVVSQNKLVKR
ncbi:MAG: T9SS type A sorting domain-containing protein, partial [Bacteroidota bacterium]